MDAKCYILWRLTWNETKVVNKLSRVRSTDWKSAVTLWYFTHLTTFGVFSMCRCTTLLVTCFKCITYFISLYLVLILVYFILVFKEELQSLKHHNYIAIHTCLNRGLVCRRFCICNRQKLLVSTSTYGIIFVQKFLKVSLRSIAYGWGGIKSNRALANSDKKW